MAHHFGVDGAQPHVVNLLVEYFSGSLTAAQDAAVESHLLSCAACRAEYDELGRIALTMTLQPPSVADTSAADPGAADQPRPADQG